MMKTAVAFAVLAALAGCATNTAAGAKAWHAQRIVEIDEALQAGEISTGKARELKAAADDTRGAYRKALAQRYKRQSRVQHFYHPFHRRHSFLRPRGFRPR